MLSLAEKNVQDRHDIGHMTSKYQMLLFYANSLYDDEQYRRAEVLSGSSVHVASNLFCIFDHLLLDSAPMIMSLYTC